MNYWTQSPDNVYVAAHRGWPKKYPENTMESFRASLALDAGCELITCNNPDEVLAILRAKGKHK